MPTSIGVAFSAEIVPEELRTMSSLLAEKFRIRAKRRPAKLHPFIALIVGLLSAALTIWLTVAVLHNMNAVMDDGRLSKNFVEVVILPLATTTIESVIAVLQARRQEMDWTIQATIRSSIGMVLFVMPVTICIGWALGKEAMTLHFEGFQVVLTFLTVLVVTNILQGPTGRW